MFGLMKPMQSSACFGALIILMTFGLPHEGFGVVLYEQKFTNTSGANVAVNSVGWNSYFGSNAAQWSSNTTVTRITTGASNPNTDPTGVLAYVSGEAAGTPSVAAFTGTFSSINIANSTITWTMGNSATSVAVQLLVQVGGSWYVSNTPFSNSTAYTGTTFPAASTASVLQTLTFSTEASQWSTFTLTPYTTMSVGSTLTNPLPSSSITGIGFYISNAANQVARLDSLSITAVPEPSAAILACAGLGLLLLRKRGGRLS